MIKRLFFICVIIFLTGKSHAQNMLDFNLSTKTDKFISIDSISFYIEKTQIGVEFIRVINSHGNEYILLTGKETNEVINGSPVRISKKGKKFIIVMSKQGNPYIKNIKNK